MTTDDTTGPDQRPPKRRPDDAPPTGVRGEAGEWLRAVEATRDDGTKRLPQAVEDAYSLIRRLLDPAADPGTWADVLARQRHDGDMAKLDAAVAAAAAAHRATTAEQRSDVHHAVVLAAIPVVLGWADLTGAPSDARAAIDSDDAGSVAGDDD